MVSVSTPHLKGLLLLGQALIFRALRTRYDFMLKGSFSFVRDFFAKVLLFSFFFGWAAFLATKPIDEDNEHNTRSLLGRGLSFVATKVAREDVFLTGSWALR